MIIPLGKNIQLEIEEIKASKTGIIIGKEGVITERGKVLSIGEDVKKVKKGDIVLFKSWALDIVVLEKEKLNFIKEDDIIALA